MARTPKRKRRTVPLTQERVTELLDQYRRSWNDPIFQGGDFDVVQTHVNVDEQIQILELAQIGARRTWRWCRGCDVRLTPENARVVGTLAEGGPKFHGACRSCETAETAARHERAARR